MRLSTQYIHQTFDAACKAHYECNSFPVSFPNVELMTHSNLKFKKFSVATLTSSTLIMIWTKIDSKTLRLMMEHYLLTQRVLFQTLRVRYRHLMLQVSHRYRHGGHFGNQAQAPVDGSWSGGPKKMRRFLSKKLHVNFKVSYFRQS